MFSCSLGVAVRLPSGASPNLRVTSAHGKRISPLGEANNQEFHAGVDIAGQEKGTIEGSELFSTEPIQVKKSRDGHGVIALIRGVEFSYYHVDPADFLTGSYQRIEPGTNFAKVSPTDAKSTAPHIHYAVSGQKKMNPDFAMPETLRAGHRSKQAESRARIAEKEAQLGHALAWTKRKGHERDGEEYV